MIRVNFKVGESHRDGRDLLAQLLHWAAHAATGISTGAEGRYHSREFGEVTERLGLKIKEAPGLGWASELIETVGLTQGGSVHGVEVLTPEAVKLFRAEIKALDEAMAAWQPEADQTARKEGRGPVSMLCSCVPPRVIRVSTGVALGPGIRCEKCKKPITVSPGQRISKADRT